MCPKDLKVSYHSMGGVVYSVEIEDLSFSFVGKRITKHITSRVHSIRKVNNPVYITDLIKDKM